MNKRLNEINKELKVYINESGFISNKCRNRLLKIFEEEFNIKLDLDNYKNVDLSIKDDFKVLYRDDLYESSVKIKDMNDLEERYARFKEKADKLLSRKEIDFKNKSNMNNISNLIIVICIIGISIIALYFGIRALLNGNYYDCLWFIIIISWIVSPSLKAKINDRFSQAKRYVKSIVKKVK